jgi:hypothetical protein
MMDEVISAFFLLKQESSSGEMVSLSYTSVGSCNRTCIRF